MEHARVRRCFGDPSAGVLFGSPWVQSSAWLISTPTPPMATSRSCSSTRRPPSASCATTSSRSSMKRTSRARLAQNGESARRFDVRIVRTGRTFRGELVVDGANGEPLAREVLTDTCPQATRALALMLALSIDPSAQTGDLAQLGQPAGANPDAGLPSANERPDAAADASRAPSDAPHASADRARSEPAPVSDTRAATAAFSFGLDVEVSTSYGAPRGGSVSRRPNPMTPHSTCSSWHPRSSTSSPTARRSHSSSARR